MESIGVQYAAYGFYAALGLAAAAQVISYLGGARTRLRLLGLLCGLLAAALGATATKITSYHLEALVHGPSAAPPAAR